MKQCNLCRENKQYSEYNKRADSKDGYNSCCRECTIKRHKKYVNKDPNKFKEYSKKSYWKNREKRLEYDRNRKDLKKKYWKQWVKDNPDKYKANMKKQSQKEENKIKTNLLRRVRHVFKNGFYSEKTKGILGCETREKFLEHFEARFTNGMNWGNAGDVWEIDHIVPCVVYNLSDDKEVKKCFNYRNMRPLGVKENANKQATLNYSLICKYGLLNNLPEGMKISELISAY